MSYQPEDGPYPIGFLLILYTVAMLTVGFTGGVIWAFNNDCKLANAAAEANS